MCFIVVKNSHKCDCILSHTHCHGVVMFMLWGLSTGKTLEARTMGRRDYSPSLISHTSTL